MGDPLVYECHSGPQQAPALQNLLIGLQTPYRPLSLIVVRLVFRARTARLRTECTNRLFKYLSGATQGRPSRLNEATSGPFGNLAQSPTTHHGQRISNPSKHSTGATRFDLQTCCGSTISSLFRPSKSLSACSQDYGNAKCSGTCCLRAYLPPNLSRGSRTQTRQECHEAKSLRFLLLPLDTFRLRRQSK